MTTDLSESLLTRLNGGDAAAGEQAFRAFEPYLRRLVRRRLGPRMRAKFDSVDVVQSVWVDLVRGFQAGRWQFADAARLRAFLVRATRNRFLNRVDRHRAAVDRERPLPPDGADPRLPSREPPPSERARRDELWERLLALCPPAHREVLRLKQEGRPLAEIAARTGLHEGSVRRILYDLARRAAFAWTGG